MELPDRIVINGTEVKLEFTRFLNTDVQVAPVMGLAVVLRFGQRCQMFYDLTRDLSAPSWRVRGEGETSFEIVPPQCGLMWRRGEGPALGAGVRTTEQSTFDGKMKVAIESGDLDPKLTWIGGSKGIDWTHPFIAAANTEGISPTFVEWAYAFLGFQTSRPRNFLTPMGVPFGAGPIEIPIPPLTNGSAGWLLERHVAPNGKNPTDSMHPGSATELYHAWRLLGHLSEFSFALVVLWAWLRRQSPLLSRKDKFYSGVSRVPGFYLYVCGCLRKMAIAGDPIALLVWSEVSEDIDWHRSKTLALIEDGEGVMWTRDNIAGNVEHCKPWMNAALVWGLLAIDEHDLAKEEALKFDARWYQPDLGVVYLEERIKGPTQWAQIPGSGEWMLPALIEGGVVDSPARNYLAGQLDQLGYTDPSNKYYGHAVGMMAPMLGFDWVW